MLQLQDYLLNHFINLLMNMKQKHNYQVVVGNVATMDYTNKKTAIKNYNHYVALSKAGATRAANEPVTLLENGEIIKEHTPSNNAPIDQATQ